MLRLLSNIHDYKQIKAAQASGGYTKGEVIRDPLTRDSVGDGTLGSQRKMQDLATGDNSTKSFSGTLTVHPIRAYMLTVNIPGVGSGKDDGNGKILGFGFDGTINYETGAYTIDCDTAPGTGVKIQAMYDVDVDNLDSLEKITAGLATKDIKAEMWTLAADIGTFTNFAFANRFGRSASDETAADLATEITNVLNVQAIKRIYAHLVGSSTWDQSPPSGVSYAEHKLTFIDAVASAESELHKNSGAGTAARFIAGRNAARVLRGMPEFVKASTESATSVGLYGTYDGIPVIRATDVIPDDEIVVLANPDGYFNAPIAYSPFMPLMVTDTIQHPNNPFKGTKAAGIWSGMTPLNGNLSTKLTIS